MLRPTEIDPSGVNAIAITAARLNGQRLSDIYMVRKNPPGLLGPEFDGTGLGGTGGGNYAAADLNLDGVVDGLDMGALLSGWSTSGDSDINGDGFTDGLDLGALLSGWTG
ncbi:MAG: hypothetical protein EXS03_03240 [Phycisphaerales bacterium]|nr:hypothetical protein [Phycisphaerales bacterium]